MDQLHSTALALDGKSLRLNGLLGGPTPQQIIAEQARLARVAMDSYHSVPLPESHDEEANEQSKDSIHHDKRENPKVGRTVKPQGKDRRQETRKEG